MIRQQSGIRIEEFIAKDIEERLSKGKIVRLNTKDLMHLVKLGSCTVPSHIDVKDDQVLGGYCASVLVRLHPNGGSIKREEFGPGYRYAFIPKEVKS